MSRLFLVCALVGWETARGDETQPPWIAVLRTSSPEDEALASRVQGQLSDLPVVLRLSPGPVLGTSDAEQWRSAVELARSESARLAIWFSHEPEAIVVSIAEPSTQHLFVRRIQADKAGGRLGHSALAEAAALAVRSAVKALEAGHEVGVEVKVEPPAPVPVVEPPSPPPPEPPPAPPPPIPPVREGGWALAVGWQAAVDGSSPHGQQGPQLGVEREGRTWRARVQLLASLQARLSDAYTRVSLSRHSVLVGAGVCSRPSERLRLGADLGLGLAGFRRSTMALAPEVSASPTRLTLAPFVGPELSARWRAGAVALEASVAVDVLAVVPTLGYQRGEAFIPRNTLWWAQPRLGLAILVGSP